MNENQSLKKLDITKLNPLSPEIIINQSTINIGTIGHVAHGKSALVCAITGVKTTRTRIELVRNITMRLGYANAKIYKCPNCPEPNCYVSKSSKIENPKCEICHSNLNLIRHISFVDCPGHDYLMATMLNGTAVMDAALLLVAANEKFPQPQTSEHLAAFQIMNLKHLIILQNKIDIVTKDDAKKQYEDIHKYKAMTCAKDAPIIPISASLGINIEYVIGHIVKNIPVPLRDYSAAPRMVVIRSFDINKAGCDVSKIRGGVAGGSIIQGYLKVGDEIEIRPGTIEIVKDNIFCRVQKTRIISLRTEENELQFAVPGGLIGVGTTLDPSLCRHDKLIGQVIGRPGTLPDIFSSLTIKFSLFEKLLGVVQSDEVSTEVGKIKINEVLMLNIGSTSTCAIAIGLSKDKYAVLKLKDPVCTTPGERIALSRKVGKTWRLIGFGIVLKGESVTILS
ncbi:eukaryotic translation initiation factor 2 subunit gamma [Tritrichomonas musculus]|uniref:protein-synthesizing GTPase n=1 Tax=Tritrichomonas musculus TaxID=1915356 RepID=A0ABR2H6D7_9EUKA